MDSSKPSFKRDKYNSNSDTQKRIRELMAERKLARNSLAETEYRSDIKDNKPMTSAQLRLQINDCQKQIFALQKEKSRLLSELDSSSQKLANKDEQIIDLQREYDQLYTKFSYIEQSLSTSDAKLQESLYEILRLRELLSESEKNAVLTTALLNKTQQDNSQSSQHSQSTQPIQYVQSSHSTRYQPDSEICQTEHVKVHPEYVKHLMDSNVNLQLHVDNSTKKLEEAEVKLRVTFARLQETESRLILNQSRVQILELQAATDENRVTESVRQLAFAKIQIAELRNMLTSLSATTTSALPSNDQQYLSYNPCNEDSTFDAVIVDKSTANRPRVHQGNSQTRGPFQAPKIVTIPCQPTAASQPLPPPPPPPPPPPLPLPRHSLHSSNPDKPPEALIEELSSQKSEIQALKNSLEALDKAHRMAISDSHSKGDLIDKLKSEVQDLQLAIETIECDRRAAIGDVLLKESVHQKELQRCDDEIERLKIQMANVVNERNREEHTSAALQAQVKQLIRERDHAIEIYNKDITSSIDTSERKIRQLERHRAELESELKSSEVEMSKLREDYLQVSTECNKYKTELMESSSIQYRTVIPAPTSYGVLDGSLVCDMCKGKNVSKNNRQSDNGVRDFTSNRNVPNNEYYAKMNGNVLSAVSVNADGMDGDDVSSEEEDANSNIDINFSTLLESERRLLTVELECTSLKRKLKKSIKRTHELEVSMKDLEHRLSEAELASTKKSHEISAYVDVNVGAIQLALTASNDKCKALEIQLSNSSSKYLALQAVLRQLQLEMNNIEITAEKRIVLLESTLTVQTSRLATLSKGAIKDTRRQRDELDGKCIALEQEVQMLRTEVTRLGGSSLTLETELLSERTELQKLKSELGNERFDSSRLRSTCTSLEQEMKETKELYRKTESELHSTRTAIREFEGTLKAKQEVVDDYLRESAALKTVNATLEKRLEVVTRQRDISYTLVGESNESVRFITTSIGSLAGVMNGNGNSLREIPSTDLSDLMAVVESLNRQIVDRDEKLSQSISHAAGLEEQLLEKDAELSELSNMTRALKNEMSDKLAESSSTLAAKSAELDILRSRYLSKDDDLATQRVQLEETTSNLSAKLTEKTLEIDNLYSQLHIMGQELISKTSLIDELKESLTEHEKVSEALSRRLDAAEVRLTQRADRVEEDEKKRYDIAAAAADLQTTPERVHSSNIITTPQRYTVATKSSAGRNKSPVNNAHEHGSSSPIRGLLALTGISPSKTPDELVAARLQITDLQEELLKTQIRAGDTEKELLYLKKKLASWSRADAQGVLGQTIAELEEKNASLQREVDRLFEELQCLLDKEAVNTNTSSNGTSRNNNNNNSSSSSSTNNNANYITNSNNNNNNNNNNSHSNDLDSNSNNRGKRGSTLPTETGRDVNDSYGQNQHQHQIQNSAVVKQLQDEIGVLTERIQILDDTNQELASRLKKSATNETTIIEKDLQLQETYKRISLLEHELDRVNHIIESDVERSHKFERDIERFIKENGTLMQRIHSLEDINRDRSSQLDEATSRLELVTSKFSQQEAIFRKKTSEMTNVIDTQQDRFKVMTDVANDTQQRIRALETRCVELEVMNSKLEQHRSELQLHCVELENMISQLRKRETQLEEALHASQYKANTSTAQPSNITSRLERRIEELEGRLQTAIVEKGDISRQAEERIAHSLAAVMKLDKMLNETEDMLERQTKARQDTEKRFAEAIKSGLVNGLGVAENMDHSRCNETISRLEKQSQMERGMRMELEKQLQMRNSEATRRGPNYLAQADVGVPMHQLEERVNDLEMQLLKERKRREQAEAWTASMSMQASSNAQNSDAGRRDLPSSSVQSHSSDTSSHSQQPNTHSGILKSPDVSPRQGLSVRFNVGETILRPSAGGVLGTEQLSPQVGSRTPSKAFYPIL